MPSVLSFDIIALIIDAVGENKDMDLLKELALVSHSFLPICSKYLFANIVLREAVPSCPTSSKKGFVKLLKSRPEVVKYIRKLAYFMGPNMSDDDRVLSSVLPNFLQTISQLKSLTINASKLDWSELDSSLKSAFLHLMHLPTIDHIALSCITNFSLSSLIPCFNLHRLDIYYLKHITPPSEDDHGRSQLFPSEMPRLGIRQFYTSDSSLLTTKLLHAKRRDGRPAFDFTDLKQLSMSFNQDEDKENLVYLLQNAKILEKLELFVQDANQLNLVGLHAILSPTARTLKALKLTVPLRDDPPYLAGLCEELEAMAGHNKLEALAFKVEVDGHETGSFIGFVIQNVEKILIKPGWSALRQVSFEISIACCLVSLETIANLRETLQSLPDKYLTHLSKLDSIALDYSAYVVKCPYDMST